MKLALFFTRNVSLKLWADTGLFDREKLIYEQHLRRKNLEKVYWLTYGKDDAAIADQLKSDNCLHPDIVILPMPRFFCGAFGRLLYSFLMPLIYSHILKSVDILKTNQMDGSWSAVITKWLYKKPLIARTGYTLSLAVQRKTRSKLKTKIAECIERFTYKYADVGVVTSGADKQYICSKYAVLPEKIKVLHNYIDTQLFRPADCEKYTDRVIFVGRLHPEKNLLNLIEAVSNTNLTLDIYGQGHLHKQLQRRAKQLNTGVNFMGVVPNHDLPEVLNRYRYYILPSLSEGMPKSLLEAMACGLVCIGTDVEGINEIIEDEVSGYLAQGTSAKALAETINKAVQRPAGSVASNGIRKIRSRFSIGIVTEQEKKCLQSLKYEALL